jgi:Ni2+-binding GTPase involved in maturation of urease and hydrogenase
MRVILVGGFLGAGKTTLLREAAHRLSARDQVVGLITNDQVPGLVDTALLLNSGSEVREVAGSCFCCNFKGFREAVKSLIDAGADCIVAEPVGSCTDLSATILQPLKAFFPEYGVAPLTVLVDPQRVREALLDEASPLHLDALYILHLQLEEADHIVLSKADTLSPEEHSELLDLLHTRFTPDRVHAVSTLTGDGVDDWLEAILQEGPAGTRIPEVDYDRYAHGEAVLGWLNAVVDLTWTDEGAPDWAGLSGRLLEGLRDRLQADQNAIGHIKLLLACAPGRILANLTGLNTPVILRDESCGTGLQARLTLNARVQISPEGIEQIFRDTLATVAEPIAATSLVDFHCIMPGRPVPTYRYNAVVR